MIKTSLHLQIYGICGYKGAGKDTFAKFVKEFNPNFTIIHFADDLKNFASSVFEIDQKMFHDPALKEVAIDPIEMDHYVHQMGQATGLAIKPRGMIAKTPRQLLQYFGTEYVRSIDDAYWVKRVSLKIQRLKRQVLVPDVRFGGEVDAIRSMGGKIIRVIRVGQGSTADSHASEAEVMCINPDVELATVTGDLSLSRALAYNVAKGKVKTLPQFDYRFFSKCRDLYLSGQTLAQVGVAVGVKGLDKKGNRGVMQKCLDYYGVPIRNAQKSLRKAHFFRDGIECKECKKCSSWKPLGSFNFSSVAWDNLFAMCRQCQSNYNGRRTAKSLRTLEGIFKNAQKTAAYRKIEFSISLQYAQALWDKAEGKCAYTGLGMTFERKNKLRATLDRIDSSLGYISGNVAWCSYRANIMKGPDSLDEFVNFVAAIQKHMCSEPKL